MNREFSIVILPKDQMIEKNSRDKNSGFNTLPTLDNETTI